MENVRKQKILIADDSEMNRSILADILGDGYEIIEAEDGSKAVAILQKYGTEIDLVLLDIVMPEMDGFEVLNVMNNNLWIEDIPVIMISAETAPDNIQRAYEMGVTDFITRPFAAPVVDRRVSNTMLLYAKQKKLINLVAEQIYEKEQNSSLMIDILSHIVEFRNGESGLHVRHVNTLTELMLRQLVQMTDRYPLSQEEISLISTASALHDIGKIAIPENILNKPGKLTDEEFAVMKTHATVGAEMLENLPIHHEEPLVRTAYEICRWHHERYDGRGYPDGLKGEEIPISAQIVALADVYDALTSERVYKKAIPHEKAVSMIIEGQCGTFNPLVLQCLSQIADRMQSEMAVDDPKKADRKEMQSVAREMLKHKELAASERTLQLLEHERMKYSFFASLTEEVQFEYTLSPEMLTLTAQGAVRLGLNEIIMDPWNNEKVLSIMDAEDIKALGNQLRSTRPEDPVATYECMIRYGEERRWTRIITRATWSSDEPPQYLGSIGKAIDIHDSRMEKENLERMASHDALTSLLNHAYAKKSIKERMEDRPESNFALAILDLDHFKSANDTYGHMFGDRVLKHMAERLNACTRTEDVVARVGGDEFLIFLEYTGNLEHTIQRIYKSLSGGAYEEFVISVSMGVARTETVGGAIAEKLMNGESQEIYDKLFHAADQALYAVKRSGRGHFRFYDQSMEEMLSVISPIDGGENAAETK